MAKKDLTPIEVEILRHNPNVLSVEGNVIRYTEDFKEFFQKEYASGIGPTQIFKRAGFDIGIIGRKRIEKSAERWCSSTYNEQFTAEEVEKLKANPNVKDVFGQKIFYTEEFKEHFIIEYESGKRPLQIFKEAGFDINIIGKKRIERATWRWKEAYYKNKSNQKKENFKIENEE